MSLHINRFLDRIRAAEYRQQRDVTMTTAEARDLHTDITRLLLALQVSHEQKTTESTDNAVINIEVQGGAF
jgi:hypothetical protein